MARKIAVVLFNLGGPDGPDDVKPFLRNLFRDPAIIGAPGPIREFLAWLISTTRTPEARKNYEKMGGGSPLLPETKKQADALISALEKKQPGEMFRSFIAMRYWHPFLEDTVREVEAWAPDEIVLLPLYPQFSTSTTGSSLTGWEKAGGGVARTICCYPEEKGLIAAHAQLIGETWEKAGKPANARILLSAHGLPEKTVRDGDPYQWQIEQTSAAVMKHLPELSDWQICYQSRVGPLKWIGPSTEEAIEAAAADGKSIILTPIAFVSEHIETLVELDEEYALLAEENGIPGYYRVPALGLAQAFIDGLADLAIEALQGDQGLKPPCGKRICPAGFGKCPNRTGENV
ncbi:ferrochelatase [Hyphobacterium sp. HN65]|uniref:Ferrochelatase n=1 Tax=Hyphobacterium lacteum TaxID=3116575 RepID=A0ABU7LRV2_9PROT|nr:ferrochelatase [Hyphobacterium sp. HN65]MEE2526628.1 ferrochelatase [Hyphobacterium sp. HN65]